MRSVGTIGIAGGIHKSAPREFRWNADIKSDPLGCNCYLLVECYSAIERPVESDDVVDEVVPSHVELAIGPDEGNRTDGLTLAGGVVGPRHGEGRAVVGRAPQTD